MAEVDGNGRVQWAANVALLIIIALIGFGVRSIQADAYEMKMSLRKIMDKLSTHLENHPTEKLLLEVGVLREKTAELSRRLDKID